MTSLVSRVYWATHGDPPLGRSGRPDPGRSGLPLGADRPRSGPSAGPRSRTGQGCSRGGVDAGTLPPDRLAESRRSPPAGGADSQGAMQRRRARLRAATAPVAGGDAPIEARTPDRRRRRPRGRSHDRRHAREPSSDTTPTAQPTPSDVVGRASLDELPSLDQPGAGGSLTGEAGQGRRPDRPRAPGSDHVGVDWDLTERTRD